MWYSFLLSPLWTKSSQHDINILCRVRIHDWLITLIRKPPPRKSPLHALCHVCTVGNIIWESIFGLRPSDGPSEWWLSSSLDVFGYVRTYLEGFHCAWEVESWGYSNRLTHPVWSTHEPNRPNRNIQLSFTEWLWKLETGRMIVDSVLHGNKIVSKTAQSEWRLLLKLWFDRWVWC